MQGISNLNRNTEQREALFISLYKSAFPAVARYISKMGGSFDEAKDIFQDALVVYYERSAAAGFVISSNEKSYLLGIAKYLWFNKHRENNKNLPMGDIEVEADEDDESPSAGKLMYYLQTAGKKCMELLRAFYYDRLHLTDAAEQFGYSSVRSATVQKYKCLEKVRETIKQRSLTYEDFLE